MKIRYGFVSNSSSQSFLIYGVCLDSEGVRQILGKDEDDEITWEDYDKIHESCGDVNLDAIQTEDETFIGKSWSEVKDTETGLQFKNRIEKYVRMVVGDLDVEFDTHERAWHD